MRARQQFRLPTDREFRLSSARGAHNLSRSAFHRNREQWIGPAECEPAVLLFVPAFEVRIQMRAGAHQPGNHGENVHAKPLQFGMEAF